MGKISWTTEKRKISDLIPWDFNPRIMSEKQANDLRKSITMAFCECDNGRQLQQISIEFRLADLRDVASPALQALRECENKWKDREQSKKILRETILSLEKLIQRLEENNKSKHE